MVTNTALGIMAIFSLPSELNSVRCVICEIWEVKCKGYGAGEQHYRSVHYRFSSASFTF